MEIEKLQEVKAFNHVAFFQYHIISTVREFYLQLKCLFDRKDERKRNMKQKLQQTKMWQGI